MKLNEFREFLKLCGLPSNEINSIISDKRLISYYNHFYLTSSKIPKQDELLFLQLKQKTPSRYCYELLESTSMQRVELIKEKFLQKCLYGQPLPNHTLSFENKSKSYVLIQFQNKTIGIGRWNDSFTLVYIVYHIGQFLHE